jgi:hypothetical protein
MPAKKLSTGSHVDTWNQVCNNALAMRWKPVRGSSPRVRKKLHTFKQIPVGPDDATHRSKTAFAHGRRAGAAGMKVA